MKTLMGIGFLSVTVEILTGCGCNTFPTQTVKNEIVTNYSTLYLTNVIVLTNTLVVTNEVIKEMQTWAIPNDFVAGQQLLAQMTNATVVNEAESLFKLQAVRVDYGFSQTAKDVLSTDTIKAKFELTLRNNGVPMNPNAPDTLLVSIEAFYDDDRENILCYSIHYEVSGLQWIMRNGEWHRAIVTIWTKGSYGTVGKLKASDALEQTITKGAEVFANDYLNANPKK